ncbi:MAG: insulinase family protein [Planctomycetes bacterium]|nr:insulinase family protein [Planctomycetota bacterium]
MNPRTLFHRHAWILVTALLGPASMPASADVKPLTTVEGITEYRLDNGLQVLLFPDNSKPTVTVNVTYFVGSRHEGRGETGMAHLLEHLVFKGTPSHPSIWKALEDHGARFNGSTWTDRTNYFETLPTTEEGNLAWALQMEADRMVNSYIRQEDLDTEMTVVRNEFEMGENDPVSILEERMLSTAYLWHNYGKSTIGSRSDIERVPIKNLQAFYKTYYQPDNAMLVIAGNFEPQKALDLVQKHFGAIPRPTRKLDDTYTVEPDQDGPRHVVLRRNGDLAAVGTAYHICAASHPDYAVLDVIQNILTEEPAGRLYKALVESGMAAKLRGTAYGWREPGVAVNVAQVRANDAVDPVLAKMTEVIEGLPKNAITEEEVKRAKARLLKNLELAMKESGRIGVELSEWAAAGDWRLLFLHRDRLEKVSVDDTRRVAALYFKESNRTSGVFYPTKEFDRTSVPQPPDVVAMLKDYKGREALAQGEEIEATPEAIEKRVTRTQLPGGMKLAMLPKRTRGNSVNGRVTLHFASEADLKGRQAAIFMLGKMLTRGSKNYTFQQLQDKLDELKATVDISAGGQMRVVDGTLNLRFKTDREHVTAVTELLGEMLRNPTFPADQFDIVRKEHLAELEEQLSEPQALAFVSMFRRLNPWPTDDVRYVPTVAESIERIKAVQVDDVKKLYQDFVGASFAEMTVVGDFDAEPLKSAVTEAIGTWKSPKPFKRVEMRFRGDVKASDDDINTPDKQMAMVGAGLNMEVRDDDPDYAALHLANYVFGASAKSRLLERLRQKEGLSYGAFSMMMADSEDRTAVWGAMAICAPQNAAKAQASMIDEFTRLAGEGIPAEELADAKKSFALQIQNRLANDGMVAGMINDALHLGRTLEYHAKLYAAIDALTPEQAAKAIKKHVVMDRLVKVKAGDLAPKENAGG